MSRRRRAPTGSAIPRPRGFGGSDAPDISITPMIDVMMSLLIIFMVVTPVLTSYGAILPNALNHAPEPLDDAVRLGVTRTGVLFIGQDAVPTAEFGARLRVLYAQRPGDHLAYLWADQTADFGLVLDAIEAARQAGVRTIGAIVEPLDATNVGADAASSTRDAAARPRVGS
jgi:biopolymer transport protein ExbD